MVVDDVYDRVHVDEKWFYIMRYGARIYRRPDEEVPIPLRSPSKRRSSKVIFLVVVARPQQLSNGAWFDGKIGIWPVMETVNAKRSGKNHGADDMETKPVTMVGEQYKQMVIKEVTPAIKARIPGASTRTIWVRSDCAKPHARHGVIAAIEAAAGEKNHIGNPATHSSDLNVLDLGFFHSIQRLKMTMG
ncbi:unnamed protein product [Discosporangium mesarthrocarpum]